MDEDYLKINDTISIPLAEFEFRHARSSGPGGQNVNKVNSKVLLRWPIQESESLPVEVRSRFCKRFHNRITTQDIFVISSQLSRDQPKNKIDCLNKLRDLILEVATPPKKRKKRRIPRSVNERRLQNKKLRSGRKQMRKPPGMQD